MSPRPRSAIALENRRSRGMHFYRCLVCHGVHSLRKCHRFLRLSVEKRLRAVLANRYCANCLAHEHSDGYCLRDRCRVCNQDHHTLLHIQEQPMPRRHSRQSTSYSHRTMAATRRSSVAPRHPSAASRQSSAVPRHSPIAPRNAAAASQSSGGPPTAPSRSSLFQRHSLNVLPTALVRIDTGTRVFDTAALIDPCTPTCCIVASLASCFRLPTTSVSGEQICSATVGSKTNANVRIDLVFKIEPHVRIRTPIRNQLSETVRTYIQAITLADERLYLPATISVVLGADVYPEVMQPGFLKIQDGQPVAQSTLFGFVLSGACHQP
ncbi:hypothetical protein KR054_008599 [Drosophila jambulina]|nr:hypothetical protein KR054_008599 [Drosophila jambulina]